jgi:serine/threonine-protein kinase
MTTIMHRALNTMPDPPSVLNVQVPAAFDDVIATSMAKRPEGRYQTAREFADDLIAVADGKPSRHTAVSAVDDDDATMVASPAPEPPRTPSRDAPRIDEATRVIPPPPRREPPQPKAPEKPWIAVIAVAALLALPVAGVVGWQLTNGTQKPSAAVTPPPVPPKPVAAIPPAPPPALPAAPYGLLKVNSNPTSAVVQLRDGSFLGITPNDIRLKPGAHDIVVKKAGYHDLESTIEIEPGEQIEFDADLVRMQ